MTSHLYTGALKGELDEKTDTLLLQLETVSPQRQWFDSIFNMMWRNRELTLNPPFKTVFIDWQPAPKYFDIETPVKLTGEYEKRVLGNFGELYEKDKKFREDLAKAGDEKAFTILNTGYAENRTYERRVEGI